MKPSANTAVMDTACSFHGSTTQSVRTETRCDSRRHGICSHCSRYLCTVPISDQSDNALREAQYLDGSLAVRSLSVQYAQHRAPRVSSSSFECPLCTPGGVAQVHHAQSYGRSVVSMSPPNAQVCYAAGVEPMANARDLLRKASETGCNLGGVGQ